MAIAPTITQDMLPEGWSIDDPNHHGQTVLRAPNKAGFLTINLEVRGWDSGTVQVHYRSGQPAFGGRGWVQALVDAAIKDFEIRFN